MNGLSVQLPDWLAIVMTVLGPAGLVTGWWAHKRASRKQWDDQSSRLIEDLRKEQRLLREVMFAREKACDAKIEKLAVRLELTQRTSADLAVCVGELLTGYDLPAAKRPAHIARIRERLAAIEAAAPPGPTPADMQALLAEIDRRTADAAE